MKPARFPLFHTFVAILTLSCTASILAQEKAKKQSVNVIGPISKQASEAIKDLADECKSKGAAEIQTKFDALSEAEKTSVDGVILLASLEAATRKKDEAVARIAKLADAKLTPLQAEGLATFLLNAEKDNKAIESMLLNSRKENPDRPQIDYRLAQYYMRNGKYDEGMRFADSTKAKFVSSGSPPVWLMLESIDCGNVRIDVHYNMGDRELNPPDIGIIRPMSFRIWSADPKNMKLIDIIDFEKSMIGGKPATAAFGKEEDGSHSNYGMLDVDSKYEVIRSKIIELVKEKYDKKDTSKKDLPKRKKRKS